MNTEVKQELYDEKTNNTENRKVVKKENGEVDHYVDERNNKYFVEDAVYIFVKADMPYMICTIKEIKVNKKDIATVVVEMYYRTAELPDVTNHLLINYRTKQSDTEEVRSKISSKQTRSREVFRHRCEEDYFPLSFPVSKLRGKCLVKKHDSLFEVQKLGDDEFFCVWGFNPDPNRKLTSRDGSVTDYCPFSRTSTATERGCMQKAIIPPLVQHSSNKEYKFRKFEEIFWNPYQLHDNDLQNFIACARCVAFMTNRSEHNFQQRGVPYTENDHPLDKLHKKDDILIHALNILSECNYNARLAVEILQKSALPILIERKWSEEQQKKFIKAVRLTNKDFYKIHKDHLPNKTRSECVEFYYSWKGKGDNFTVLPVNKVRRQATIKKHKNELTAEKETENKTEVEETKFNEPFTCISCNRKDIIHFMETDLCSECGISYYKYGKKAQQFKNVVFLEEPAENVLLSDDIQSGEDKSQAFRKKSDLIRSNISSPRDDAETNNEVTNCVSTEEIATSSEITADVDYTTVKDEGEGTDEVLKQGKGQKRLWDEKLKEDNYSKENKKFKIDTEDNRNLQLPKTDSSDISQVKEHKVESTNDQINIPTQIPSISSDLPTFSSLQHFPWQPVLENKKPLHPCQPPTNSQPSTMSYTTNQQEISTKSNKQQELPSFTSSCSTSSFQPKFFSPTPTAIQQDNSKRQQHLQKNSMLLDHQNLTSVKPIVAEMYSHNSRKIETRKSDCKANYTTHEESSENPIQSSTENNENRCLSKENSNEEANTFPPVPAKYHIVLLPGQKIPATFTFYEDERPLTPNRLVRKYESKNFKFYGHERSTCSRTDFTWKKVSKETNKDGTNRDQIKIKIDDKRSSFDNIHCHDRFSRSSHEQDKNTQNNQSDNSDYQGNKVVRPVPHHHGIQTTSTFDQQKGRYHLTASRTLRHMSQGFQSSVTPSGSSGNFSKEQLNEYNRQSSEVIKAHRPPSQQPITNQHQLPNSTPFIPPSSQHLTSSELDFHMQTMKQAMHHLNPPGLIQGATQNPLASSLPTIGLHLPQTPHDIHLAAAQANLEASRLNSAHHQQAMDQQLRMELLQHHQHAHIHSHLHLHQPHQQHQASTGSINPVAVQAAAAIPSQTASINPAAMLNFASNPANDPLQTYGALIQQQMQHQQHLQLAQAAASLDSHHAAVMMNPLLLNQLGMVRHSSLLPPQVAQPPYLPATQQLQALESRQQQVLHF